MTTKAVQGTLFEVQELSTIDPMSLELDDIVPNKGCDIFAILLYDGQNYVNAEGDVLPIKRKKTVKQEPWPNDISFLNH